MSEITSVEIKFNIRPGLFELWINGELHSAYNHIGEAIHALLALYNST